MYEYKCQLVRVVDGDTVRLDIDLGFGVWMKNKPCRLMRIDAPPAGTAEGDAATTGLTNVLAGKKHLTCMTQRSDIYGRYLVELYGDDENISDWLVENKLAVYVQKWA